MAWEVPPDWLTGVRVERLGIALCETPSNNVPISIKQAVKTLWTECGGPFEEIHKIIELLTNLNLVSTSRDLVRRTTAGDKVARAIRRGNPRELALILIRSGFFYQQARTLIESGAVSNDGQLVCSTRIARAGAPQLLAVLQSWDEVRILPVVMIPPALVAEMNAVWALLPPKAEIPKWAAERKAVGDRAEMYTVQYERTRIAQPSKIVWVAQDSDSIGWDVEDHSVTPSRCIEVKGRRDHERIFFLSENEWRKAQELPDRYLVHFWGGIDLHREPAIEYAALRAQSYPLLIEGIVQKVQSGEWIASADRWRLMPASNEVSSIRLESKGPDQPSGFS